MDRKKISISAINLFSNELPDVKVFLEDKGTLYTFNGMYDGCRSLSAKLLLDIYYDLVGFSPLSLLNKDNETV